MKQHHQQSTDEQTGEVDDARRQHTAFAVSTHFAEHLALIDELERLRGALARHDDSDPTLRLDPARVVPTRWANRHESAYSNSDFLSLKESIALSGGNVQPILVREAPESTYEIVFGHRRHRACLELGLPVLAVVSPSALSDLKLYMSMEQENRARADLSAFEQGASYLNAINTGLFPSRRRLAEALGVSHTWVSKAISVAELPAAIVDCFNSPVDIQPRHAAEITQALGVDPDRVLAAAEMLRVKTPKLSAVKIVQHLLSRSSLGSEEAEIKVDGSMIGSFRMNRRGHALVKLDMAAAKQLSLESISNALRRVLHVAREEARKDAK